MLKVSILFIIVIGIGACSTVNKSGESEPTTLSSESKKNTNNKNATYVTDISFDKRSSKLDNSSLRKLNEILYRAKKYGEIDDIKVISWSDEEHPSTKQEKLSKIQKDLAQRRAENIKKFLKQNDNSLSINTFNMAKRPDAISKLLKTEDVKTKRSLEAAGITKEEDIKLPNKAGKSTVLVILKEQM